MHELAVVMPVYNEDDCILQVANSWLELLQSTVKDFEIILLNDGSTDSTADRLAEFSGEPRVRVIDKDNEGHGPTILRGYVEAAGSADWIFQVDSDDEIQAVEFPALWREREGFDLVMGYRKERPQAVARYVVSACSRLVVHALCGRAVLDVNVPFRLMRRECLEKLIPRIPPGTFAPNLIISGLAGCMGARVTNVPVACKLRATAPVSLTGWSVWRAALLSLRQTISILLKERNTCAVSS